MPSRPDVAQHSYPASVNDRSITWQAFAMPSVSPERSTPSLARIARPFSSTAGIGVVATRRRGVHAWSIPQRVVPPDGGRLESIASSREIQTEPELPRGVRPDLDGIAQI